jgi:hypothetical protein
MATSIGINSELKNRLTAFKKSYKLRSYENAIEVILRYIEVVGDDPTNPKFTAKAQLEEMVKRLNQVIAFIRVFEKDKLKPVLSELEKVSRHVLEAIPSGEAVVTKKDVQKFATKKDLHTAIYALVEFMESHQKPEL